ncbi:MAG: hypothetical protein ACJAVK_002490, partial [Akkermansiaceae bacterium]
GNAGEVDLAIGGHDAGGGAIEGIIETIGEELGVVHLPVAIAVFEHADLVGVLGVVFERFHGGVLLIHREAFGGGGQGDIVSQPMLVAAVVLDTTVEAVGLGEIEAVLFVKSDGGDVEGIWLAGVNAGLHFSGVGDGGEESFVGILGRELLGIGSAFNLAGILFWGDGKNMGQKEGAQGENETGSENHRETNLGHAWNLTRVRPRSLPVHGAGEPVALNDHELEISPWPSHRGEPSGTALRECSGLDCQFCNSDGSVAHSFRGFRYK